ncbi:MAG: glutathione S-transferase family protein, partial [Candidatus Binatia bacterium]
DFLRLNPHGAVPVLVDGDQTVAESAAIVMYLAEKYPEKKLAPALGSPARARYFDWIVYAPARVDPLLETVTLNTVILPESQRDPAAAKAAAEKFRACGTVLSAALGESRYLLGEEFSAADVVVGYCCFWARFVGLLGDYPALGKYLDRLSSRPAFQKATAS